ncbi:MAG: bifunctional molybdenum cofactor biosynthesis protein MoaC/MoaB [Candidatus Obscuribacterales bacterium]|nr:bifunctional molybdenum cofactor biosynthesis protein MoaC/MoaB [Candidatus Obscuribacterales bacterium]
MKDISHKIKTLRVALAQARLNASPDLIKKIKDSEVPKGDPLPVAKVAAVQAAKNTSLIIPYCHPIPVDFVGVDFTLGNDFIEIDVTVKAIYKTGVEMEALTAASVAALTIYDMLKVFDESMEIVSVRLLEKHGGKSDWKIDAAKKLKAAVIVVSDSVAAGKKQDVSGKLIVERLETEGLTVSQYTVVADDEPEIESTLKDFADRGHYDIVFTTGGTGLGPRDRTPEVMQRLLDLEIPGIAEAARTYGQERMPMSMLSRARAGVRGNTLIINLPGSSKAVKETLDALLPSVLHTIPILHGAGHEAGHAEHKPDHKADPKHEKHEHKHKH